MRQSRSSQLFALHLMKIAEKDSSISDTEFLKNIANPFWNFSPSKTKKVNQYLASQGPGKATLLTSGLGALYGGLSGLGGALLAKRRGGKITPHKLLKAIGVGAISGGVLTGAANYPLYKWLEKRRESNS